MSEQRTVIVTGGAGYIGSHCCKELKRRGFLPVTYDNLVYGHREAVQWGPLEEGDINDAARLDEVFAKYQPVAVMHFAAYAYVGESVQDPGKYFRNNVSGALTVLETMLKHGIKKFVFSSTCATYGEPEMIPITEDANQRPINPYGLTKLQVEQMLKEFSSAYDLRSISFRYFNASGADPDGQIGENHVPETHLIPLVLDAAIGARPFITVFGQDYPTPDGTCIRDYIHVTDLATAHVLGLEALLKGAPTQVYNLGNGAGFSVKEIIDAARKITGKEIPVKLGERRPGDPPRLVGDAARAKKELGWKTEWSGVDSILKSAWDWHQKMREKPAGGPSIHIR